jgi:hypothetical protein
MLIRPMQAAVESRNYQTQLLQAEIDKFSVGEITNYMIVQWVTKVNWVLPDRTRESG